MKKAASGSSEAVLLDAVATSAAHTAQWLGASHSVAAEAVDNLKFSYLGGFGETASERERMKRMAGVVLSLVGLLIVVTEIAIAFTSGAETWICPFIVGGGIALLGLFVTAIGWAALRGSPRLASCPCRSVSPNPAT
jgi:drug/metabolite transporter (DMT)-like permease